MKERYYPIKAFYFVLLALFCSLAAPNILKAQISVTHTDIEQSLEVDFTATLQNSEDTENILELIQISGEDQVWDFTTLTYDELTFTGTYRNLDDISALPESDDPHFADATHGSSMELDFVQEVDGETYEFYMEVYAYGILNEDELLSLGGVFRDGVTDTIENMNATTYYDPPRVEMQFPLTYGSTWEYEYESEAETSAGNFSYDYQNTVEVDGWGEIITNEGTENVLRLKITEISTIGGMEFADTLYSFINEHGLEVASISGYGEFFDPETEELSASQTSYSMSTSNEIATHPENLELNQNYPNPFNPSTVISFNLPEAANVQLEVFDMLGQKVATLIQGERKASGKHSVVFDAEGLSSGTYMYRLIAGEYTLSRKLMLIK